MKIVKIIWQAWKKIAHKIGIFQSRLLLTVFYILLAPLGIVASTILDLLKLKSLKNTSWQTKLTQSETLEQLKEQY